MEILTLCGNLARLLGNILFFIWDIFVIVHFSFLNNPHPNQKVPQDNRSRMELDPTKNEDLHLYIWKKLLERIEKDDSLSPGNKSKKSSNPISKEDSDGKARPKKYRNQ